MIDKLEKIKEEITKIQRIMISVSTGRGNIDDSEEEYRKLYFSIKEQLKSFQKKGVQFPDLNFFSSLWDFYSYWEVELKTYQERREYVRSLYKPIDDAITQVLMKVYNKTIDSNNLEKLLSSIVEESVENKESETMPSTIGNTEGSTDEFEYDIAISFAGEDRETAENIASGLIIEGVKVFYDRFFKVDMWGKKLTNYFQDVYGPKARFVMVLISKHYPIKDWTDFEFSIAREEAKKRKTEFILPVRLDDTKILGIHEDVGYLDLESEGIEGIVDAVLEKLPKRKELHSKITKGIFVTTLGVNFEDLVGKEIISKDDWRNYQRTCDKLEADLRAKLDKSTIGEYHFTEPSARTGETLSVRFAHKWDLMRGLPDFSFTGYWDFLEFRPVEEVYTDSWKDVKSLFNSSIFEKNEDKGIDDLGDVLRDLIVTAHEPLLKEFDNLVYRLKGKSIELQIRKINAWLDTKIKENEHEVQEAHVRTDIVGPFIEQAHKKQLRNLRNAKDTLMLAISEGNLDTINELIVDIRNDLGEK